jgi:NADPH2:quinone reductase
VPRSRRPVPPFDPQRLNAAGSLFLTRPTLAHYTHTPDEFGWRAGELLNAIADGTIAVTISERYRLEDAGQAHRDLQGRKTVGSVVLVP